MTPEEAHRRALADVNGDPYIGRARDLTALAMFVFGLIALVALVAGHVTITIK